MDFGPERACGWPEKSVFGVDEAGRLIPDFPGATFSCCFFVELELELEDFDFG